MMLGGLSGMFIGGFLWSHESITGRQFRAVVRRAAIGAAAGLIGGAAGAGLGSTVFTTLGSLVVDAGGFKASLGVVLAVALGWAILGAAVGLSGGMMIRSRERVLYGLSGGTFGGWRAHMHELSANSAGPPLPDSPCSACLSAHSSVR
jgi:hypothetical protein